MLTNKPLSIRIFTHIAILHLIGIKESCFCPFWEIGILIVLFIPLSKESILIFEDCVRLMLSNFSRIRAVTLGKTSIFRITNILLDYKTKFKISREYRIGRNETSDITEEPKRSNQEYHYYSRKQDTKNAFFTLICWGTKYLYNITMIWIFCAEHIIMKLPKLPELENIKCCLTKGKV